MIFLDVGAHEGQTLEEVTKPGWGFTTIYGFEPMLVQYEKLYARYGGVDRFPGIDVWLFPAGLSGRDERRNLYGSNAGMEASVFPDKFDVDESVATECGFLDASKFFRDTIPAGERVIVKLNCEGSEVEILDSLLDSGSMGKVENVMIDFDIRKVPGRAAEADRILGRFEEVGFDRFSLCEDVMKGETHQERIAAWLKTVL